MKKQVLSTAMSNFAHWGTRLEYRFGMPETDCGWLASAASMQSDERNYPRDYRHQEQPHHRIGNRMNISRDDDDEMSAQEVKHLLLDLISLSGQNAGAYPALELQIGEIVTRTSVEPAGLDLYLAVTGLLPPCAGAPCLPALSEPSTLLGEESLPFDFLWHADHGRYIVVRKIPLHTLSDERAVMDEILDTADIASRCFDAVQRLQSADITKDKPQAR